MAHKYESQFIPCILIPLMTINQPQISHDPFLSHQKVSGFLTHLLGWKIHPSIFRWIFPAFQPPLLGDFPHEFPHGFSLAQVYAAYHGHHFATAGAKGGQRAIEIGHRLQDGAP